MHADLILEAIETIAVVAGVLFGLIQLRQLRLQREVEAGEELLRPLQAADAAHALPIIRKLARRGIAPAVTVLTDAFPPNGRKLLMQ